MDHEPRAESEPDSAIDRLPESLGFHETEEMGEVRQQLAAEGALDTEAARELRHRYQELGQEVVSQGADETTTERDIGLTVRMALLERDSGASHQQQLDTLYDAVEYASNMGFDDVVAALQTERARIKEIIAAESGADQ